MNNLPKIFTDNDVEKFSTHGYNRPAAAIDMAVLKEYQDQFGEDGPEMMSQFIEMFFENAPEVLAEMQQAVAQRDAQTINRAAHSLKGNGVTFGAMYFSELCYQLEKYVGAGLLEGVEDMAAGIQQEFNRCKQELLRYLETLQVTP